MLDTPTVKLVPLDRCHLAESRAWANDAQLNRLMLRVLPATQSSQEAWYEGIVHDPSKIVFAIETAAERKHLGNTGLYHIDWIHRRAEFWILLGNREYWGQGIGGEVVTAMKRYAFDCLNLHRLQLHVAADNEVAIRLYHKAAFVREGLLRKYCFIEAQYVDVLLMAVLREEPRCEK